MTSADIQDGIQDGILADLVAEVAVDSEAPLDLEQTDRVFSDLWGGESGWSASNKEELSMSGAVKFELEALTVERDRLKKEKKRLSELLENIQLEEVARLKDEVAALSGENEQLLVEIQRRRPVVAVNISE
jgi:hypothetical protein